LSTQKAYRFLLVILLSLLAGCTTEKNTRLNRAYFNTTAHYNIYFNGKESLKAGVAKIDNSKEDDFTKILPIFKSSDPGTATTAASEMEVAIEKASKLIKTTSITKKPKRRGRQSKAYKKLAAKEEYNNWIDDAYLLMGKAYFFQHKFAPAVESFSYVIRKYNDKPIKYEASIWLIRAYTEMERYVEAWEVIQQMQGDDDFPKHLEGHLAIVIADYYARQLDYQEGIPFLSIAAKKATTKANRLRYKYILAQWYNETGDKDKALQIYREIVRMNPPYRMAFNARINAADAFAGSGDASKLKKELNRMLRDSKNQEFRDQIYFALGSVARKEGNKELALDMYKKSAAASISNVYQRGLSCLTLAQIYFDDLNYKFAQAYYDSAMVVIDEKYPNYQQIAERHKNLTRLVENLNTVEREDSLQRIAKMPEKERNQLIDKWLQAAIAAEQKKKQDEATALMDRSYYRVNESRFGLSQQSQQNSNVWYFYNPTTVAYGKVEFERLWGKRKLEDNWRISDKKTGFETDEEQTIVSREQSETQGPPKIADPKTREYYTQDLPLTDSLMAISHLKIRDALYNAGRIFKADFSNYNRSIEEYEDLDVRYPENIYKLSSYFELWDLYKRIGNTAKSEEYKNRIVSLYPDSKYAKYLLNPNYFIEQEVQKDSLNRLYQQAFYKYRAGDYATAGKLADMMSSMEPDSLMKPKIDFFRTVSQGTQSDWNTFGKQLRGYINEYPKAETKPLAEQILSLINDSTLADYQKLVAIGYLSENIRNDELKKNANANDEFGGKFSYDEDLLHYFVLAIPQNADIDVNRLKFDIANYNLDHYTKIDFDIETQLLNSNTQLIVVRPLMDKEQSLIYFRSIIRKRDVFQSIGQNKYFNFVASSTNFREIVADKSYDEYLKFFIKNYSRFISGDFPQEEVTPEPEELMEKAITADDNPEEKGTFVVVNAASTPASPASSLFTDENQGLQNFVIVVNDPKFNMTDLFSQFSSYLLRSDFKDTSLKLEQKKMGNAQLLIVKSFARKDAALGFFTKTVANRRLFRSLEQLSYRNFVITDGNLQKLLETKALDAYLDFFKNHYISDQPVSNASTAPAQEQKPAQAAYAGPYKTDTEGAQLFMLMVPKTGVSSATVASAINAFNQQNYPALKTSEKPFDDNWQAIVVEGLKDKEAGLKYLRALVANQQVYGPLETVDYRNFIISPQNFTILSGDKNIKTYLDFYKRYYLGLTN
jgi:hypothetical protein